MSIQLPMHMSAHMSERTAVVVCAHCCLEGAHAFPYSWPPQLTWHRRWEPLAPCRWMIVFDRRREPFPFGARSDMPKWVSVRLSVRMAVSISMHICRDGLLCFVAIAATDPNVYTHVYARIYTHVCTHIHTRVHAHVHTLFTITWLLWLVGNCISIHTSTRCRHTCLHTFGTAKMSFCHGLALSPWNLGCLGLWPFLLFIARSSVTLSHTCVHTCMHAGCANRVASSETRVAYGGRTARARLGRSRSV